MADLETLAATKRTHAEGAAPSTPSAGEVVIYAKTDGNMYQKDDAGTETSLAGAGGSSVFVGASIYKTSDQLNLTASTLSKVTFESAAWDSDSFFDDANDRLTVPATKADKYLASGICAMKGGTLPTTDANFQIRVNGTTAYLFMRGAHSGSLSGAHVVVPFAIVLDLAVDDYVELHINPGDKGDWDVTSGATFTHLQLTKQS